MFIFASKINKYQYMEDLLIDSITKKIALGETLVRFEKDWFSVNFMFNREFTMKCLSYHFKFRDCYKTLYVYDKNDNIISLGKW